MVKNVKKKRGKKCCKGLKGFFLALLLLRKLKNVSNEKIIFHFSLAFF